LQGMGGGIAAEIDAQFIYNYFIRKIVGGIGGKRNCVSIGGL